MDQHLAKCILLEKMNNVNKIVIISAIERGIEQDICVSAPTLTDFFAEFLGVELLYIIIIDLVPFSVLFNITPVMASI